MNLTLALKALFISGLAGSSLASKQIRGNTAIEHNKDEVDAAQDRSIKMLESKNEMLESKNKMIESKNKMIENQFEELKQFVHANVQSSTGAGRKLHTQDADEEIVVDHSYIETVVQDMLDASVQQEASVLNSSVEADALAAVQTDSFVTFLSQARQILNDHLVKIGGPEMYTTIGGTLISSGNSPMGTIQAKATANMMALSAHNMDTAAHSGGLGVADAAEADAIMAAAADATTKANAAEAAAIAAAAADATTKADGAESDAIMAAAADATTKANAAEAAAIAAAAADATTKANAAESAAIAAAAADATTKADDAESDAIMAAAADATTKANAAEAAAIAAAAADATTKANAAEAAAIAAAATDATTKVMTHNDNMSAHGSRITKMEAHLAGFPGTYAP